MDLSVWKPGLHPFLKKFYDILQAKKQDLLYKYDVYVDAKGIYLILGVQEGAFKKERRKFSLAVTSSTKVTCFWQNYEESS